jgi:hypothetical protein
MTDALALMIVKFLVHALFMTNCGSLQTACIVTMSANFSLHAMACISSSKPKSAGGMARGRSALCLVTRGLAFPECPFQNGEAVLPGCGGGAALNCGGTPAPGW